MSSIDVLNTPY